MKVTKANFIAVMSCAVLLACSEDDEPAIAPAEGWELASPSSQNIEDLSGLDAKASALARLTSVAVVRNGKLVYHSYHNGYKQDSLHDVRSVTKSVVGLLVGKALEDGAIGSIDDPIDFYLPDEFSLNEKQKEITIHHLLNMSGGFQWNETNGNAYNEWVLSEDPMQFLLDKPIVNTPGSTYNYNSAAVHLLGVVLANATGSNLKDYAQSVLFDKIEIPQTQWESVDETYFNGGSGIRLRTLDLARIGQLVLNGGTFKGESVVPVEWVNFMTTPAYSWTLDYGFFRDYTYGNLFWVHEYEGETNYLAWGYGGQFIYISPPKNLVIVTTTNWIALSEIGGPGVSEQQAFDLILNYILPRVK
ncbi:MAG: serine hydrolase [Cyclobacteriaceae bacterium]|nr:serine hydrolase [Cyclobacteriaceae bacterium]